MLLIVGMLLIFYTLIFPKSKFAYVLISMYMFILFGWNYGGADYSVYYNRYYNYQYFSGFTEKFFNALMIFFNKIGISFNSYQIILAFVYVSVLLILVTKECKHYRSFIMGTMLIYPFCMDVTQQRFTIATLLFYIGFYFYINKYESLNKKKTLYIYFLFIAIASGIHSVAITFIIYLLVKNFSIKKCTFFTFALIVVEYFSGRVLFDLFGNYFAGAEKVQQVLNRTYQMSTIKEIAINVVLFSAFSIFILVLCKKFLLKNSNENTNYLDTMIKANILCLFIIPLLSYSQDFYRVQQALLFLNLCTIGKSLEQYRVLVKDFSNFKIYKKEAVIIYLTYGFVFFELYRWILNNNNFYTVFMPLIKNNQLLK